jgi:hypothetical protein
MKTTNYEISKQLAEAGFEGETNTTKAMLGTRDYPAFHLETILEKLPKNYLLRSDWMECFLCGDFHATKRQEDESLADTAAKLWLKLKKEGLVK